jgi:hypothetical protein
METQEITLTFPEHLLQRAQHIATQQHISLSGLLTQTLETLVIQQEQTLTPPPPVPEPTQAGAIAPKDLLIAETTQPIWSPYDSFDAAQAVLEALQASKEPEQ